MGLVGVECENLAVADVGPHRSLAATGEFHQLPMLGWRQLDLPFQEDRCGTAALGCAPSQEDPDFRQGTAKGRLCHMGLVGVESENLAVPKVQPHRILGNPDEFHQLPAVRHDNPCTNQEIPPHKDVTLSSTATNSSSHPSGDSSRTAAWLQHQYRRGASAEKPLTWRNPTQVRGRTVCRRRREGGSIILALHAVILPAVQGAHLDGPANDGQRHSFGGPMKSKLAAYFRVLSCRRLGRF